MTWALSPRLALTSLTEMGRTKSFALREAAMVKSKSGTKAGAEPTRSIRIVPGGFFDADGTKSHNLVVVDGGKRFVLLSVRPGTIITAEGERLEMPD